MASLTGIEISGLDEFADLLGQLPKELVRSDLQSVARAALKPVEQSAKARLAAMRMPYSSRGLVPKHALGLLHASIGIKTKFYSRSGTLWASVGPRTGFKAEVKATRARRRQDRLRRAARGQSQFRSKWRNPVNYAHLVELGFNHPTAGHIAPRPFIRPAFDSYSQTMLRDLGKRLGKKIESAGTRLAKKKFKQSIGYVSKRDMQRAESLLSGLGISGAA